MPGTVELIFQGTAISKGCVIGKVCFVSERAEKEEKAISTRIKKESVSDEISRFHSAIFSSQKDLKSIQENLKEEGAGDAAKVIDCHIELLKDPLLVDGVEENIRRRKHKTELAVKSVVRECREKFTKIQNTLFKERLVDISDVSTRVLNHLKKKSRSFLESVDEGTVLFLREITPSQAAQIPQKKNVAVVTRYGSHTSHAALILKAKGIPFVSMINLRDQPSIDQFPVIVDGDTGEIIVSPSAETVEKCQRRIEKEERYNQIQPCTLPSETLDGQKIEIFANAGNISDIELSKVYGEHHIGLFRTEFLYFEDPDILFNENKQFELYKSAVQLSHPSIVQFRVFDLGGDKAPSLFEDERKEENPLLGCRGIRFLLKYEEVFRLQVRALLRVSQIGPIKILLPMVSTIEELHSAKEKIVSYARELNIEGQLPEIGVMIETPSAAMISDLFAEESPFFSLGTNDLIQYTQAIDRTNAEMSDFFYSCQPGFIRLLKMILENLEKAQKPLLVCGEIASNPVFTPLVIGLGVSKLSIAPRYIPGVKKFIREITLEQAQKLAREVLNKKDASDVSKALLEFYNAIKGQMKSTALAT